MLKASFKPFFILSSLLASLNPLLWSLHYTGKLHLSFPLVSTSFWHGHEMLFGFVGALIAGFILTAVPNWTQTKRYEGKPLLFLILIWILERLVFFVDCSKITFFILINLFFPTLIIMLLIKLWKHPKQRFIMTSVLLSITTGKIIYSYSELYSLTSIMPIGRDFATSFIRIIILIIIGRVLPFFMTKKIDNLILEIPKWLNILSISPLVILAFSNFFSNIILIKTILLFIAIWANSYRLILWQPKKSLRIPMLWILQLGVFLIILSMVAQVYGLHFSRFTFSLAPLHIMMSGGLGLIGAGMMTRVFLGHTQRFIKADRVIIFAFILILFGSLFRTITPIFFPDNYIDFIPLAGVCWSLGFFILLTKFTVFSYIDIKNERKKLSS